VLVWVVVEKEEWIVFSFIGRLSIASDGIIPLSANHVP